MIDITEAMGPGLTSINIRTGMGNGGDSITIILWPSTDCGLAELSLSLLGMGGNAAPEAGES